MRCAKTETLFLNIMFLVRILELRAGETVGVTAATACVYACWS